MKTLHKMPTYVLRIVVNSYYSNRRRSKISSNYTTYLNNLNATNIFVVEKIINFTVLISKISYSNYVLEITFTASPKIIKLLNLKLVRDNRILQFMISKY